VKRYFTDLFGGQDLLFDLMDRFRIGGLDSFSEPVTFQDVKDDNADHHDEQKTKSDLFEIADDPCHRSAEEISEPREKKDPQKAACPTKPKKTEKRHLADSVG